MAKAPTTAKASPKPAAPAKKAAKSAAVEIVAATAEPANPPRNAKHAERTFSRVGVGLSTLPPAQRISLRAPEKSLSALSKALGVALPTQPKTSASAKGRHALWLGPDEWLVVNESGADLIGACAKLSALHSAVDVSHRNVALAVVGSHSEATLSAGCPQNLSLNVFPVGACSRTILGKVEVVIYRTADDAFHVECWRSFSDYVWDFLTEAAKDAAA